MHFTIAPDILNIIVSFVLYLFKCYPSSLTDICWCAVTPELEEFFCTCSNMWSQLSSDLLFFDVQLFFLQNWSSNTAVSVTLIATPVSL